MSRKDQRKDQRTRRFQMDFISKELGSSPGGRWTKSVSKRLNLLGSSSIGKCPDFSNM
jgi:hypothetical protein